ncbi:YeeE/YedE family protein [Limnohabitans sp.]|uniref:YeeE/YedE family protein n=1 Tax=Limnohabitans sp. TaxID=1907725 RepID=UPI00286F6296|nr:YeeE/YedE family protein [Limnohabitans sp.]
MTIDWLNFTPLTSLAGGLLLGIAASLLFIYSGRILGITGILEGLLPPKLGDTAWRFTFVLGLVVSPLVGQWLLPGDALHPPQIDASWPVLIVAGLLVGVGTRWGAGCTSGHGICGLSRLSLRSLIATLSFMATGFLTVFVIRHVI